MPHARTAIDRKDDGVCGCNASHNSKEPRTLTIVLGDRGILIHKATVVPGRVYQWRTSPNVTYAGPVTARLHRCQYGIVKLV